MRWIWLPVVIALMARVAVGGVCTGLNDDAQCYLSDGATTGSCAGGACTRIFTVPAGEARTGTGTISSSGGVTVTGSGTVFTSELQVGDTLIAGGQRVAVTAIASNTSLSTDPALGPPLSAASFQFSNPIITFLDENGVVRGLINARGLVAFGQPYANGPLTIIGLTETAAGALGKGGRIQGGNGGPADATSSGGSGGSFVVNGGVGGSSSFVGQSPGVGGDVITTGGFGGSSSVGIGGGAGSAAILGGDAGTSAAGFNGSPGGSANVVGGAGSSTSGGGTNGNGGNARLTGGSHGVGGTGGSAGDTVICDNGGTVKLGTNSQTQLNCATGGFTKIRNVTVSAFPPANAAGFMKNDGSGNYTLSAVTTADVPAAVMNAVNAFVHANAGGI